MWTEAGSLFNKKFEYFKKNLLPILSPHLLLDKVQSASEFTFDADCTKRSQKMSTMPGDNSR